MLVTHRSTYQATNVIVDTEGITSACSAITFDNYGDVDCQILINGVATNKLLLPAGRSIDLGGMLESIILDTFDISFPTPSANQGINIIRETYLILT